jgi:hypothetical protein
MSIPNYLRMTEHAKTTIPPNANLDKIVTHLHDAAYAAQLVEDAVEFEQLVQANYVENMHVDHFRDVCGLVSRHEFQKGQGRKAKAGATYQHVVNYGLSLFQINVTPAPKGSTVDAVVLSAQLQPCALLSEKRTLKERWSGELKYGDLARATGTPQLLITHDDEKELTQTKIDEIREKGFTLVLRDYLIEKFKPSPFILPMSELPKRLKKLMHSETTVCGAVLRC